MHADINGLGSFLSAVKSFTIEFEQKQQYSIVIANTRFSFYREAKRVFYVVGRSNEHTLEETIIDMLKIIYQRFCEMYENTPEKSRNDPSTFTKFKQIIETIGGQSISKVSASQVI